MDATEGTIFPVSLNVEVNEELINAIKTDSDIKIKKVERLKQRKKNTQEWEDSLTLKVTFHHRDCPSNLKIYSSHYQVRPFIPFPTQCWRCQRFGHTIDSCKSTNMRCRKCSGNHNKKDCISEQMKCANCNGQHNSNSKDCPLVKQAKDIEKYRVLNKASYTEARQVILGSSENVIQNELRSNATTNQQKDYSTQRPLYSQMVHRNKESKIISTETQRASENFLLPKISNKKETGTQTEIDTSTQTEINDETTHFMNSFLNGTFYVKLKNFILEIFQINSANESHNVKCVMADSAIRNHFGVDVTENSNPSSSASKELSETKKRKIGPNELTESSTSTEDEEGVLSDRKEEQVGKKAVDGSQPETNSKKTQKKKKKKKRKVNGRQ